MGIKQEISIIVNLYYLLCRLISGFLTPATPACGTRNVSCQTCIRSCSPFRSKGRRLALVKKCEDQIEDGRSSNIVQSAGEQEIFRVR
jgi:hypothetical protein